MTRDEWREHKDFDELSHEMIGDFSAYRINMLTNADNGGFLMPKKQNTAQVISDAPKAE